MTRAANPPLSAPAPTQAALTRGETALFHVIALLGGAPFWLAPGLPMNDLPQHVAQVALWRDLILGVSPFSGEVWINLLTPYLIGYGLALPFAFVMDPTEALRLVMAASFVGFLAAARALRRDTGGDARLDWLLLFGFFGLAWHWGFYTFLVAAPLALLTIRAALRHADAPTPRRAAIFFFLGAALLLSHGLQFLFALAMSGAILLERALGDLRAGGARAAFATIAARLAPYAALCALFVLFMLARRLAIGADPSSPIVYGGPVWAGVLQIVPFPAALDAGPVARLLCLLAWLAPLAMGFRPRRGPAAAMMLATLAIMLVVPSVALDTAFLYERFAIYLLPFWAMTLRPDRAAPALPGARALLVLAGVGMIVLHGWRVAAFAREDAEFEPILAAARPGERVLAMIFETDGRALDTRYTYLHWGVWMQARRGAFVDFNFAYFAPQVVRFRPGKTPAVLADRSWEPEAFEWNGWNARIYDAFLTRGRPEQAREALLARAPVALEAAATSGSWTLWRVRGR